MSSFLQSAAPATQQALVDYLNGLAQVSGYASALAATRLPVLTSPFPGYAEYADRYAVASAHALDWSQGVLPLTHAAPEAIVNLSALLQRQSRAVAAALATLADDPSDADAQAAVRDGFAAVEAELRQTSAATDSLYEAVEAFAATISADADALSGLADAAVAAADGDADAVKRLAKVMNELRDQISTLDEIMTLDTLGKWDFKLFLVVVGLAAGIAFANPLAGFVVGILGATFTSFVDIGGTSVTKEQVAELQKEIDQVTAESGALTTDLGILHAVADSFRALSAQASGLSGSIAAVAATWSGLTDEVNVVLADFEAAEAEVPESAAQAAALLAAAGDEWSELEAAAAALVQVEYVQQTAPSAVPPSPQH